MNTRLSIWLVATAFFMFGCSENQKVDAPEEDLFELFANPSAEARPFVRWWWNGDHIEKEELKREVSILKAAGFGGVEINPIAMPEDAVDIGTKPIEWLSDEWCQLLAFTANEIKNNGMIADMIVGSGWPFGGEFLKEDETTQRIIIHKSPLAGNAILKTNKQNLIENTLKANAGNHTTEGSKCDIMFVSLVPTQIKSTSEIIELSDKFNEDGELEYQVPAGSYELITGVLQAGFRKVMHGALGAAGQVMDHYDKEVTLAYLNRLKKISDVTGIPLNELLRALFCDSIELSGANWTDNFEKIFFETYNYKLETYFPYIFYHSGKGYDEQENFLAKFADEIKRVRYDYNKLLVKVFLDNFTRTFQQFCTENGLKCRYQAYGTPFLMGMMEGNMIADIPESNNWIYSSDMENDAWNWNQGHGYMIWNLYTASGGHLTGKKIISCEAMTNTKGVFKTSLEEIKQHDDMNFISGINHTVLHGYNYSPLKAGFPGWIRYGAYFNEQNTWWPYIDKWVDYNARLSAVFQHSKPMKNIAIVGPSGDLWGDKGLVRAPFHLQPWYCYRLWEPLSQAGSSCDYISEKIISEGKKVDGQLKFGDMAYQAIILAGIQSLEPETATAIKEFVEAWGKLIIIDSVPSRSLSLQGSAGNDAKVKNVFDDINQNHAKRVFFFDSPKDEDDLLNWTKQLLAQINIRTDASIDIPDRNVYQIHKKAENKDIYFFTNSHKKKTVSFTATFPTGKATPWIWNPEDGTRKVFPYNGNQNELSIELQPLQSLLIVFDPDLTGNPEEKTPGIKNNDDAIIIESPWLAKFTRVDGHQFERSFEELQDLSKNNDPELNTFAGTIDYTCTFTSDGKGDYLEINEINRGVTEVYINNKLAGINWYGRPVFKIKELLQEGENTITMRHTTVLANYVKSLKDNKTAQRWTSKFEIIPVGIEGAVKIYE